MPAEPGSSAAAPKLAEPLDAATVWANIARHPYEYLVRRWNWKSAATSTLIRGAIFFTANLTAGKEAAVAALLTEFTYRALLSGIVGSVTQALRKSEPAWAAGLSASVILPAFSHAVEFTAHSLRGTPRLGASIGASIAFTVISILFNLYAMRHGVLVVDGENPKSLWQDLVVMPRVVAGFLLVGPLALWRLLRGQPE